MIVQDLLNALNLPFSAQVNQRVPKSMLIKNGAPTAVDKRRINEGIEEIQWLAALKPTTIGVPEYRDAGREYLEIAVISVVYRQKAKASRLNELIHRAIPYPVWLASVNEGDITLSLAHKRWSQGESGATVLDGPPVAASLNESLKGDIQTQFMGTINLSAQPRTHLYDLYQGWIDTLVSLLAAQVTGTFQLSTKREQARQRHEALGECARLEAEIAQLRSQAKKEKQTARLVAINLEMKQLEAALKTETAKL